MTLQSLLTNQDMLNDVIASLNTFDTQMGTYIEHAVKPAVSLIFYTKSIDHLIAVSGASLSPALATCETSQLLLAGVSGGFSWG